MTLLLLMALQPSLAPAASFSFLILNTVGRTPSMGDQPVTRLLTTQENTQNKYRQTSMPLKGELQPMIPVFERAKTSHALDRMATVIGFYMTKIYKLRIYTETYK